MYDGLFMLRSLTLALGKFGEKGVKAFAPLLKSQKTLKKLKFISSNISVDATEAIFELLPSIERIENLYFIYNKKAGDATETLSKLVNKCLSLKDFNFSKKNKCIAVDDIKCIARASVGSRGQDSSLAMLDLEFNRCGVSLSQVISGYIGLTEVYLRHMNLQNERVISIARSLKNTAPSLRVLTVGGNDITAKAAPALAECLAVKYLLITFSAEDNKLKDDGAVVICKAVLKGHKQLRVFDLSANAMTGIGAKAAAEAVANKPNFKCLYICENFITKKGIETVKDVLRKGTTGESVLAHPYQYKDVGAMQYEYKEEGLTDSDSESEEKLQ